MHTDRVADGSQPPHAGLTRQARATLGRLVERLLPADAEGPGALEIGIDAYIERMLARSRPWLANDYATGLAALDEAALEATGERFDAADDATADRLIGDYERRCAAAGESFFAMLLAHVSEGVICDPVHGGNRDASGWRLLGFPGPRLVVPAADHELDAVPAGDPVSAYSLEPFRSRP